LKKERGGTNDCYIYGEKGVKKGQKGSPGSPVSSKRREGGGGKTGKNLLTRKAGPEVNRHILLGSQGEKRTRTMNWYKK